MNVSISRRISLKISEVFCRSKWNNFDEIMCWFTFPEAQGRGWKIELPDPTPTRTVDDVLADLSETDKWIVKQAMRRE